MKVLDTVCPHSRSNQ